VEYVLKNCRHRLGDFESRLKYGDRSEDAYEGHSRAKMVYEHLCRVKERGADPLTFLTEYYHVIDVSNGKRPAEELQSEDWENYWEEDCKQIDWLRLAPASGRN
jgi:hypothetical protein